MSEKCEHDFTFSTECRCGLDIRDYVAELQAKIDELEKKLKIAKEALEKYANQARWESIDINCEKFYCAHSGSQFAYDALKDIE